MSLSPRSKFLLRTLIFTDVVVAAVNLVFAYRRRSAAEAIIAVVIWLVLGPLFAVWWVRKMEK